MELNNLCQRPRGSLKIFPGGRFHGDWGDLFCSYFHALLHNFLHGSLRRYWLVPNPIQGKRERSAIERVRLKLTCNCLQFLLRISNIIWYNTFIIVERVVWSEIYWMQLAESQLISGRELLGSKLIARFIPSEKHWILRWNEYSISKQNKKFRWPKSKSFHLTPELAERSLGTPNSMSQLELELEERRGSISRQLSPFTTAKTFEIIYLRIKTIRSYQNQIVCANQSIQYFY